MKSGKPVQRLALLVALLLGWDGASGLCSLDGKATAARCHELEDARYIETYQLHSLRAACYSRSLQPGNFRNLTSLRHLDLSAGRLERIAAGSFAELTSLRTLNLAGNRLSRLEAGAFDGLESLHSLKLGDNAIARLPPALLALRHLALLDLSGNPLACDCASLELRDALLARGVVISKKSLCARSAVPLLQPDARATCLFERQDEEMQADQPATEESADDGSGEEEPEEADAEEKEPDAVDEELPETGETEAATSSTAASSRLEDAEPEVTTSIPLKEATADEEEEEEEEVHGVPDDLVYAVHARKNASDVPAAAKPVGTTDELVVQAEGSGDAADYDEGSGVEGSGMIVQVPGIDFNETGSEGEQLDPPSSSPSSASTTSTSEDSSWDWGIGSIISSWNPFAAADPTEQPAVPEKSPAEEIAEDGFIPASREPVATAVPPGPGDSERGRQSPRTLERPEGEQRTPDGPPEVAEDESSDPAYSKEAKKGAGSYVVLAILLAVLALLIGTAAYKGDFCRRKRKRGDVERGTELKDMQRSLLEQGAPPAAKIQPLANGATMENVPLIKPNPALSNGSSRPAAEDPVKPPRRPGQGQEIEPPLNGLDPPMEPIDAADAPEAGSRPHSCCSDDEDGPALGPGARRVKITVQENPDSVPKTPILITRLKAGENIVKAP